MNNTVLRKTRTGWNAERYQGTYTEKFRVSSAYDEAAEIDAVLKYLEVESHHQNVLLIGMRNFKLVQAIAARLSKYSNLIVVEPTEDERIVLQCSPETFAEVAGNGKVSLIIGGTDHVMRQINAALYQKRFYYNAKHFKCITAPYIKASRPKEVGDLFSSAFEGMRALMSGFGNSIEDILVGYDNFVNNWSMYLEGLPSDVFKDGFREKPCIIVGAGPSLDKNIKALKSVRHQALVIAVDAALDRLLEEGIVPDSVATIERTEKSSLFYDKHQRIEDIVFLGPSLIQSDIISKFDMRIFTGRAQDPLIDGVIRQLGFESLEIGANVSHLPLAFAKYMGCDPIVFVGMDLAYQDDRTHAGSLGESHDIQNLYHKDEHVTYVKGQSGEQLKTLTFFMYAKKHIEQFILMDGQRSYYNCTGGGAEIYGAQNRSLEDVFGAIPKEAALNGQLEAFYRRIATMRTDAERAALTDTCIAFFNSVRGEFEDFKRFLDARLREVSSDKAPCLDLLERHLQQMDEQRSRYPVCSFIIQSVMIDYHNRFRQAPVSPSPQELESLKALTRNLYKTLDSVSDKAIESLEAYVMVLESQRKHFDACRGGHEEGMIH